MTELRCAAIVALLAPMLYAAEPPAVQRLFPPGGQQGTEVEVTLNGKTGDGDLRVWSDHNQLSFQFAEQKNKATVSIPEDSAPGVHWLRFYNEYGCTDLRPFFVGTVPEIVEAEPNNGLSESQKITSPMVTINGVLEKAGEVDLFAIQLDAKQTLVASVQANRELGSPMDGVLQILDVDGTVVASNDDSLANDPLVMLTADAAGVYYVRLFAFPAKPNSTIRFAGANNYVYRLTMTTGPLTNHVTVGHLNVSENHEDQTPLPIPLCVTGLIGRPGETDRYFFEATKGQSVTISVTAHSHFSLLDPLVVLQDSKAKTIKEFDDISRNDPDVKFSIALPESGQYSLSIEDRYGNGGDRYTYVAGVKESKPTVIATVSASSFVLPKDKPLEIPVAINRTNGFSERIAVSIENLPDGLTSTTVYSEKEGDTSKKVTLKIERTESAKKFSGVVGITCKAETSGESTKATAPRPNSKETISKLWLTVTSPG